MIRTFIISLVLLIPSLAASAQGAIEKIVNSLEDNHTVNHVLYSERRDPMTHDIIQCTRLMNFTDSKLANRIIQAMKKERGNSVNYQVNTSPNSSAYCIEFITQPNRLHTKYALMQDNSMWTFSIQSNLQSKSKKKSTSRSRSTSRTSWGNNSVTYTSTNEIIEHEAARTAAREAREEARKAREEARKAREEAREQARKTRRKAHCHSHSSSSSSSIVTTVVYEI